MRCCLQRSCCTSHHAHRCLPAWRLPAKDSVTGAASAGFSGKHAALLRAHTHTRARLSLRPVAWEHFAQTNIFGLGAGALASPCQSWITVPRWGELFLPPQMDGRWEFSCLFLCAVQKQELLLKTRLYVVFNVEIQDPVCQQMSRTRRSIC